MSHPPARQLCPGPRCARTAAVPHRPVRTPARTPPPHRPPDRRCGPAALAGHRTPGGVRMMAQRVAEVLVGRRAPEVLRDHVTVAVREELRRLRGTFPCERAPRLPRVFHQPLAPDGVEASALIPCERRSRAFAFRARHRAGRWVCTSLETDGLVRGHRAIPVDPTRAAQVLGVRDGAPRLR
ncbi:MULTISPECIES: Rv3235 family protein [unclassified Nocardiopsis]|uniref:Rv3235 family protein n=1 Tax=unclassified Nocardiopsis TaxID=2649073 RepID=UPI00135B3517|nr:MULTISPECIES: Rv3235 family protein [unclassified Nocardiopsis]